jgi:hypothetical protein
MTRAEYLQMLASAVEAGWITAAEASALRQQQPQELPLPLQEAIPTVTPEHAVLALVAVVTLLKLRNNPLVVLRSPPLTREQLRDRLQTVFQARARVMALLPVSQWHAAMRDGVRDHLLGQYALGLGRPLRAGDVAAVQADVQKQLAYLSRFADERAAKALAGRPMSDAQVAVRSELYSGSGRAAYFRGAEQSYGVGWVHDYEAVDDRGTCTPCLAAEQGSPYLAGQGSYPGSVCLGRGHCRCVRVPRFSPAAYRRLAGRP